ncbi:MAG: hypothetical protein ACRDNS_28470 [Trebonia sp.]
MTTTTPLFDLLPVVYRLRDAENGGALEALLELVSGQVELLKDDLYGLWDNLFIETCDEWVVPYIGDLVSNTPLYEIPGVGRRVDVADTIDWRRRKGTPPMLGALAHGVTGWGALAVATFELLSWNQNLNHLRMLAAPEVTGTLPPHPFALDRVGTVNIRDRDCLDRIDGAFDQVPHTVDVRAVSDHRGWYGIHKVCFFSFRLVAYPMAKTTPATNTGDPAGCYHFSPLGQDAPVFHLGVPVPVPVPPSAGVLATETNVDAPIRPYRFYLEPELDWDVTLNVYTDGTSAVPVGDIICKDLSGWADVPADKVGVDVRNGRFRFGSSYAYEPDALLVDACYGFSADIAGGPYSRVSAQTPPPADLPVIEVAATDPTAQFQTIEAAVAHWQTLPPADVRIVILDSATYLPAGGKLDLSWSALTEPVHLTLAAADTTRPLIVADIRVKATKLAALTLDGLLVSGMLAVAGPVAAVTLADCTLVPGVALDESGAPTQAGTVSLTCDAPSEMRTVSLARCITGPLLIDAESNHLSLSDGILDAATVAGGPAGVAVALAADAAGKTPGPESTLERMTVFGSVYVRQLTLASESIFVDGTLRAQRRQVGCVRFSSLVPKGSLTPRRYRCQPDLVRKAAPDAAAADEEERRVRPEFADVRFGQPAYAQLAVCCAPEVRQGAEAGTEMGAFQSLLQPYRETNLRVRLGEYLPVGLEPGIVHVT